MKSAEATRVSNATRALVTETSKVESPKPAPAPSYSSSEDTRSQSYRAEVDPMHDRGTRFENDKPEPTAASRSSSFESHSSESNSTPVSEERTRVETFSRTSPRGQPQSRSSERDSERSSDRSPDRFSDKNRGNRLTDRPKEKHSQDRFQDRYSERHSETASAARSGWRDREGSKSVTIGPDFGHLATSLCMAAGATAAMARVISAGSKAPQGMLVLCAALSAIPAILLSSWGLTRINGYLKTSGMLSEYSRFFGWALICTVPWAYTLGNSLPIAMFTTFSTCAMIVVAFAVRFKPDFGRLVGVGAGFATTALAALYGGYHLDATRGDPLADSSLPTAPSISPPAAVEAPQLVSQPVSQIQTPQQPAQQNQPAQPVQIAATNPSGIQPLVAQNPPTSVNDQIPAIPAHDSATPNRAPANTDPTAKAIVDPLAHEEFFSAIKIGNLDVVKSLIDRKVVDPDFTLDRGNTPLIAAAAAGRIKVVEYLIRRKVNINAQDPHGTTALMWAVFKGHRDVAQYLVSKGADTKILRDDGDTALDIARKWKQTDIAHILQAQNDEESDAPKHKHSSKKRRH